MMVMVVVDVFFRKIGHTGRLAWHEGSRANNRPEHPSDLIFSSKVFGMAVLNPAKAVFNIQMVDQQVTMDF